MAIVLEWPSKGFAGREQRHLRESEQAGAPHSEGWRETSSILAQMVTGRAARRPNRSSPQRTCRRRHTARQNTVFESQRRRLLAGARDHDQRAGCPRVDRLNVPGSVFWDIGANIGVLTLYAAMRGDLKVWAFEPAAVNYYNLVANCELNGLERRVRCLQLGFTTRRESWTCTFRN